MAGIIYCGDNLEVLGEYVPRDSVDLIYLDPPFNSQQTYNLIYEGSKAQEVAFKDCWSWEEAAATFATIIDAPDVPKPLRSILRSLHESLVENDSDQLAYLVMMTPRLLALHRALRATGSLYLHCDPTASHYLKVVMDTIFGLERFQNEIIWQRTTPKALQTKRLPTNHDTLLLYRKGESFTWNSETTFAKYDPNDLDEKTERKYAARDEEGRRYQLTSLLNPSRDRPNLTYEFLGVERVWRWTRDRMQKAYDDGLVVQTKPGSVPRFKRYLDTQRGKPLSDVWTDVLLNSNATERIGYPTQKPMALLERIIAASSNEGDVVLDPFCGCGTTVEAAERAGRRWIGIDIARKAIEVIEARFKRVDLPSPEVTWHPEEMQAAEALAARDKHQFEDWVLRKIRAARIRKKDRGIDGEALFKDKSSGKAWHVLVSVKGGKHLAPTFVRDLRGTIEREGAPIGVLISMHEPSKEMRLEAARAGFLPSPGGEPVPRIQLLTVERLFAERRPIRVPGGESAENVTDMPKPVVPAMPGSSEQLALPLDRQVTDAKPVTMKGIAKTNRPAKKQPVKAYPMPVEEMRSVAESTRPSKK